MTAHERFTEIYHQQADQVLGYARYRVGGELAEDVVAETFVIAWQKLDKLPDPPRAWLLATARRVSANQLRARRTQRARQTELDDCSLEDPHASMESIDRRRDLIATLRILPPLDREAVLLVTWYDLTNSEAADVMGCSVTAFAVRLHRARRRLARILRGHDNNPKLTPAVEETK